MGGRLFNCSMMLRKLGTLSQASFCQYAKTFKGRRQLVWSRGLKDLAGIEERSDERLAEDEVEGLKPQKRMW